MRFFNIFKKNKKEFFLLIMHVAFMTYMYNLWKKNLFDFVVKTQRTL